MQTESLFSTPPDTHLRADDGKLFQSVVEHWAKARIDNPLHVISRYDEVARHVIVIAGVLEGLMVAVLNLGREEKPFLPYFSILSSALLLVAVLFAVFSLACPPKQLGALRVYQLFRSPAEEGTLHKLDVEVRSWCEDIAGMAAYKHRLTRRAMLALAAGIGMIVLCITINTLIPAKGGGGSASPGPSAAVARP